MRRRGPDHRDWRQFRFGPRHASLLHSRLSIIDLEERSSQPFRIGSKNLSFNGELYNYLELRRELETEGYRFVTKSDTEVLLRVIDAWGWQGLDRCEGMWAFAVYDEDDGSLTLCRDRFGEKPLYLYRTTDGGFYFASEVKFISALANHRMAVNYDHLMRFMVNGYRSLFKQRAGYFIDLEQLPPATVLKVDAAGAESSWRYWTPDYQCDEAMSYEDAVAGVRQRLIRSVELRLRSDVPLAFCLSSGIDSNSLISIAKRELDFDVHGFTITNSDARYDESELTMKSVAELGIDHTAISSDFGELLPRLRQMVVQHDGPVSTITSCLNWVIEEAMADAGYKITVSGTAADEIFTGYFDHHNAYLFEVRNDPELFARSLENWNTHIRPIVRNPFLQNPRLYIENPGERRHIYLNNREFADYLHRPWQEPFIEAHHRGGLLRNRMLNELLEETVPVVLRDEDFNAMNFSIENRSPFLDRDLFEFCNSIPTAHLIRDGAAKAVLRDAMRGIVPDEVLDNRRKVGLNAPILEMLDVSKPEVRQELLADSPIFDFVRKDKIETLVDRAHLPNSESKFLFNFVSAKAFLDEFAA